MEEGKVVHTLQTHGLTVGYRHKNNTLAVASQISMTLSAGELVALVGINGSGKSTLLRTLAGLQSPLQGKISLLGRSKDDFTPNELAQQLSVVLTNQVISKNLSVLELVSLGRQPYLNWIGKLSSFDKQQIEEALKATDCYSYQDKKCYELSDGQLQRVLIARALAQDPAIMILDEPLSHLDLHHKAALLKLLKSIARTRGTTILYATHDIEHSLALCDHIMVLQDGNAIIGKPETLMDQGVFNRLFPSKHISFDTSTGRFSIDK